jgi:glycosyltransferase involved in cell wall biosynthesis
MKMVVFVVPSSEIGGTERTTLSWCKRLPEHGWTAAVFVQREGPMAALLREQGYPVSVGSGRAFRNAPSYAADLRHLFRLIKQTGSRIVVGSGAKGHVYGGPAALFARVPAIWFLHDLPDHSMWSRLARRIPGSTVANSKTTAIAAKEILGKEPPVVYPAIEIDKFAFDPAARLQARASLGWSETDKVAGYLGRLQAWKGVQVFLEALAVARKSNPALKGAVVGSESPDLEPGFRQELQRRASVLGLVPDGVQFLPFQQQPERILWALDCLVHVPLAVEPFGMSVVEAMAAGRWLIVSKLGGPGETVTKDAGELVTPGDVKALSGALSHFASDPRLTAQALRCGPERAQVFDARSSAGRLAQVLEAVTS